jgi:hypothetical protein
MRETSNINLCTSPPGEGGAQTSKRRHNFFMLGCLLLLVGSCVPEPSQPDWPFGAATGHNIATLAENPHDLSQPREETARDATRRDAALSIYRAGTSQRKGGRP